jgi:hypothetical protein
MCPTFEQWCADVLHPEDTHPWNFRTLEFYDEYRAKYGIARMVQPKSILEVGVRFGYGARSFLYAAPEASYMGLDFDEPSWGPYKGVPRDWAELQLRRTYPLNHIKTMHADTQHGPLPPLAAADLVHIDGDHSYQGALNDITNFWPLTRRVMVVDDFAEIPDVRRATVAFAAGHPDVILLSTASMRGSAVLVREG